MNQEGLLFPKGIIKKKRKKHHKSIIDRDMKGRASYAAKPATQNAITSTEVQTVSIPSNMA